MRHGKSVLLWNSGSPLISYPEKSTALSQSPVPGMGEYSDTRIYKPVSCMNLTVSKALSKV